MLGMILLISFLYLSTASSNILSVQKQREDLRRFSLDSVSDVELSPAEPHRDHDVSPMSDKAQDLLNTVNGALLIKGMPWQEFRDQRTLPLIPLLPARKATPNKWGPPVTVKSINVANCSSSAAEKAIFVVRHFDVSPNSPVPIPGTLTFSFDINILQDIKDFHVQVEMMYKTRGTFVKIPCLGGIGSCPYDICDLLSLVQDCPEEFTKIKINCKCPFNKGAYIQPGFTADIDANVFPTGEYFVNATLTSGGDFAGCYTADFTIEAE